MKKFIKITSMMLFLCMLWVNVLPVSAETTTVAESTTVAETTTVEEKTTAEEKPTERETTPAEDTETEVKTTEPPTTKKEMIYVSIKDKGVAPAYASPIYIYTGKPIKPVPVVTKGDGTEVDKSDYTVEYTGDYTNPGNHGVRVVYKKNGYAVEALYQIIPGTTDKINVKVKDGQVTVSWNPVPGAKVYRVYKYDTIYVNNEKRTGYFEMLWPGEKMTAPKTSRTFTSEELKPGGKYKMAIMALPEENWMPTNQMAYFTVDTTKDTETAQKPVTTTKPAEKPSLITPQPTKPGETVESVATTTPEAGTTVVPESTTGIKNVFDELESVAETLKSEEENEVSDNEKDNSQKIKIGIIIAVIILAVAGIVFSVYKKKNNLIK